jgi:septation ring formation regulator EzrA
VIVDVHFIATAALGVVCGVLGWLSREIWAAVKELRKDLSDLREIISRDYVRYDRLQDALRPVLHKLERIEDALTQKQDKAP